MLRFTLPAIMCIALCCPILATAQDCGGCGATPAAAMDMNYAAPAMDMNYAAPAMDMNAAPAMDMNYATPVAAQAAGCGCNAAPAAPCQKTRKKLQRVCTEQQVSRLKRVCSTDSCGCPKSKLVRTCETVKRSKFQLVDVPVDPCKQRGGRLKGMFNKLKSMGGNGCCPAPAPSCGCAPAPAPAPCGCN